MDIELPRWIFEIFLEGDKNIFFKVASEVGTPPGLHKGRDIKIPKFQELLSKDFSEFTDFLKTQIILVISEKYTYT